MNLRRGLFTVGVVLAVPALALVLHAQEPAGPVPGQKSQSPKAAEKSQDVPREAPPKAQAEPAPQELKTQESKDPGDQKAAAKPLEQPVRSAILSAKLSLMSDPRLFPYDIDVSVKGQEALLTGTVASEEEKVAAGEIVRRMEGIKSVLNKLVVVKELPQTLKRRRDELINQYVKERFKRSKTLEKAGFDVETDNGVVSLKGSTRFQVIVLEAAEAARQVPGVKAVRTEAVRLEAAP